MSKRNLDRKAVAADLAYSNHSTEVVFLLRDRAKKLAEDFESVMKDKPDARLEDFIQDRVMRILVEVQQQMILARKYKKKYKWYRKLAAGEKAPNVSNPPPGPVSTGHEARSLLDYGGIDQDSIQ